MSMKTDFGSLPRELLDSTARALERHIVLEREERVAAVDELREAVKGLKEEWESKWSMLQGGGASPTQGKRGSRRTTVVEANRPRVSTVDGRGFFDPASQVQQKINQSFAELELELDRKGNEISERMGTWEMDNKLAEIEVSLHEKAKGLQKVQLILQQNLGPSVDKLKQDLAQASAELRHDLQELRGTFLTSCLSARVQNVKTAAYVMNHYGLGEEDRKAELEKTSWRVSETLSTVKDIYKQSQRDQVRVMRTIHQDLLSKIDLAPPPFQPTS